MSTMRRSPCPPRFNGRCIEAAMTSLKWLLLFGIAGYVALVALLYLTQRSLLYFPDQRRLHPVDAGLGQAEEVMLQSADGLRVSAWHVPPRQNRLRRSRPR